MTGHLLMATAPFLGVFTFDIVDPFGDGSGIALYKFDGDATDRSGVYNGTASNVTYGTGKFGSALEGGTGKYVTVPISPYNVSISQWVYLPSTSSIAKGLWSSCSGTYYGAGVDIYPNQIYVDVWNYNNNKELAVATKPISGWNHIYTYMASNGVGFIVVNGVKETFSLTSLYGSLPNTIDIGRRALALAYADTGVKFDQARFFNRALTQEEVTALYNERVDSYTPYVPPPGFFNDGTEIAHYAFDGDAIDSADNFDGTATGVTYAAGKIGQCGVFNGTNTYDGFTEATSANTSFINLGAHAPELFSEYSGKPRTYSAWVALSSSTDAFVLNYGNLDNQTSPYYFKICFTSTLFHVRTQSFQPNNTFTGKESNTAHNTTINYGTFYHIAFVFPSDSTGVIKFYINGNFVGQATHTVWSTLSYSYDVWLQKFTGNAANSYAAHYVGCKIDSLRVFNRALSQEEIIALYNEGQ